MTKHSTLDISAIRNDFPIFEQKVNGHPLIYLDNAATTPIAKEVVEAMIPVLEY